MLIIVKFSDFNYIDYSSTDSDSIYFSYKANKINIEADTPLQNNVNLDANSGRTTSIPPLKRQHKRSSNLVNKRKRTKYSSIQMPSASTLGSTMESEDSVFISDSDIEQKGCSDND